MRAVLLIGLAAIGVWGCKSSGGEAATGTTGGAAGAAGAGGEAGVGGGVIPGCELGSSHDSLCAGGAPCPFSDEGKATCNDVTRLALSVSKATGGLLMAVQASDSPLYTLRSGALTKVDTFDQRVAVTFDETEQLHAFFSRKAKSHEWMHRTYAASGPPTDESMASFSSSYLVPAAAVERSGQLAALAIHGDGGNDTWELAARAPTSGWQTATLPAAAATYGSLSVADDGTPIVSYFATEASAWHAKIRVGDTLDTLPFEVGNVLATDLAVVAGPTSWAGAAVSLEAGVQVVLPSGSLHSVSNLPPLRTPQCETQWSFQCASTCTDDEQGVAGAPAGFRLDAKLLLARIETVIARTYSVTSKGCFEHGCQCVSTLESDASKSELVFTRLDTSDGSTTEVGRFAIPVVIRATLATAQRGTAGAIAWLSDGVVRFARVDLAALDAAP